MTHPSRTARRGQEPATPGSREAPMKIPIRSSLLAVWMTARKFHFWQGQFWGLPRTLTSQVVH